jgi:hypothetical protein
MLSGKFKYLIHNKLMCFQECSRFVGKFGVEITFGHLRINIPPINVVAPVKVVTGQNSHFGKRSHLGICSHFDKSGHFGKSNNFGKKGQGPPNAPTFLTIDSCSETHEEQ